MAGKQTVGIAGAGVVGRVMALKLVEHGFSVTLFDRDNETAQQSCSWTGAGMLSPYCEIERAELIIGELGTLSVSMWPEFLATLTDNVFFQQAGTLVVAHPNDDDELVRMARNVSKKVSVPSIIQHVGRDDVATLEPELASRFSTGLFFPGEGQVDNRGLLRSLATTIKAKEIQWHTGVDITHVGAGVMRLADRAEEFDWVVDCRGLGARSDIPTLRGVRGELLLVRAPEVRLNRPVRMLHPRYALYIVPRPDDVYVIGATAIDSDDDSPMSVRSALELLSAAYSMHSGFAEARILDLRVACRPAFPDNLPRIEFGDRLMRVNGLFRHGFLLAPVMARAAVHYMETGMLDRDVQPLMQAV